MDGRMWIPYDPTRQDKTRRHIREDSVWYVDVEEEEEEDVEMDDSWVGRERAECWDESSTLGS
jgi:hypothetical protein